MEMGQTGGRPDLEKDDGKKSAGKKDVARSAARYAVRYTIARIIAKPTKSVGARLLYSSKLSALSTVFSGLAPSLTVTILTKSNQ